VVLDDAVDEVLPLPGAALQRVEGVLLDRLADREQPAAGAQRRDAGPHPALGVVHEGQVLGPRGLPAADDQGDRGVTVPALDGGAAVDGDQDTLAENQVPRYPVDDLVVVTAALRAVIPIVDRTR